MKKVIQRMGLRIQVAVMLFLPLACYGSRHISGGITLPTIPLDSRSAQRCALSLKYPEIISEVSCTNAIDPELGAGLWIVYYRYRLRSNAFHRQIEGSIFRRDLSTFIEEGAAGFLRKSNDDTRAIRSGIPQLAEIELLGDCGLERTRVITVASIRGANWKGWRWEQSFNVPRRNKKLPPSCKKFTNAYRCVGMVFGNNKMSAVFPTVCYLRKKVNNLDTELSFDVFMDMIKTIRFKEGELPTSEKN